MTILIIAEHDNASIKASTLNTVAAAAVVATITSHEIHVLVAGYNAYDAADAATRIAGISNVLLVDAPEFQPELASVASTVIKFAQRYSYILAPATAYGKSIAQRIAVGLDVSQIRDVTAIGNADSFETAIYAGNAFSKAQSNDPTKVITVCISAFQAVSPEGGAAAIEKFQLASGGKSHGSVVHENEPGPPGAELGAEYRGWWQRHEEQRKLQERAAQTLPSDPVLTPHDTHQQERLNEAH